jgi:hypothetical protein
MTYSGDGCVWEEVEDIAGDCVGALPGRSAGYA